MIVSCSIVAFRLKKNFIGKCICCYCKPCSVTGNISCAIEFVMLYQVDVATRLGDSPLCKPPKSSNDCDMKHLGAHVSLVSVRNADTLTPCPEFYGMKGKISFSKCLGVAQNKSAYFCSPNTRVKYKRFMYHISPTRATTNDFFPLLY